MPPSRTPTRWSTGKWIAAILAVAVHLGFIVFLIFSVTWQNSKPEAPKPRPEPPKPEPKVEAPQPTKADIALKEKQERERKQKEEKDRKDVEKREADKRDAEKKKQDEKRLAETLDRQTREADALKAQANREQALALQAANAARSKANDAYVRSIQLKVKGNVLVPADLAGNPEAIFEVVQLPTGE